MNPNLTPFARRTERVEINGVTFVCRELETAADMTALRDSPDYSYLMMIRCVFMDDGITPAFTDADVDDIKAETSVFRMQKLFKAVHSVNGLDAEEEAKNSEAAPTSS